MEVEPRLMAKALWEDVEREHSRGFKGGDAAQLRAVCAGMEERHGSEQQLFFPHPGSTGLGSVCRSAARIVGKRGILIAEEGKVLAQKVAHVVLPHSNREWARVSVSESFLSLKAGRQSALWELGGVPGPCQRDNWNTPIKWPDAAR